MKFSIIRAIDNPSIANKFARHHSEVLRDYGVNPTSANDMWIFNPDAYMFIAVKDGQMIGGMRLDVEGDYFPMPLVRSLRDHSPELIEYVARFRGDEIGEVCAWWILKHYAGLNIPALLLQQGIDYAKKIGLKEILGFPHQYTMKIMTDLGFSALEEVGDNGSFREFPDIRYTSTVVKLKL
jgi:hypothetical protein